VSAVAQSGETIAVRESLRFDQARLEAWLQEHLEDYQGPLRIEQFRGGQSNPTYKLLTPRKTYILRRKPPGVLLKGAHAIEREARVVQALRGVGFPVASVRGVCTDDHVIGTWFYVQDYVTGRIFWEATLPGVSAESRPLYFDAMNAQLAQLHRIDHQAIGLADFGRAGNYFERQIARWSRQYETDTADAGRVTDMERLIQWLPAHIPPGDETSILHGDYRVDNMIFHPSEPRVLAILDWELSTLGHPLADFTYHLMMYRLPPKIVAGLRDVPLDVLNIPSEEQYVQAYCRRTGREGIAHLDFYMAFNMFRLAAIFHGIRGRMVKGTAASARAAEYAAGVEWMAELAWDQTRC
jgi:aminoglycoside phosphotransferase (APT) family kinase protein